MKVQRLVVPLAAAASVYARPLSIPQSSSVTARSSPNIFNEVLLFDGLAYPDPSNAANTLLQIQAFVSLRTPDLGIDLAAVTAFINSLGIQIGNSLSILEERIKIWTAIGLPGKAAELTINGCAGGPVKVKLPKTDGRDLGLVNGVVSLGNCQAAGELEAVLTPGFLDSRTVKSSVFASPDSGFGVISDIDDTIKISNVLDKLALVKSTFLEEPKPIPGMPELYSSLATSLNNPTFAYLTASPYQLYPFLNDFIDTSFSGAKGPLFTQNLTIVDIPEVIDFITSSNTFEYKTGVVDRLQEMYPNKKWLLIGDSTQKDPEVYAAAFAKHGPGAIACIWIREVEGADNSAERFGQIFRDIPQEKVKIFKDSEIASLRQVNVAAGQCS
ncbi:hypothetical protein CC2G_004314 [Coprinopsis cinerea AmutBmut pab1-1]|nr:hypothetical protein CC2G_004314 [Coprinopsis cinerea AmutBmut pab1-1]